MKTQLEQRVELLRSDIDKDMLEKLVEFSRIGMNACGGFVNALKSCETYGDLKDVIEDYNEDIASHLGVEDKSDEVYDLEEQVSTLEKEIWDLEDKALDTPNLWDEQRLDAFKKFKDKYTPWELEKLLEHGRLD